MRKIFFIAAIAALASAQGFTLKLGYDCGMGMTNGGNSYNLTIGMDEKATNGLDREFDSPAPPIPPEICYANFVAPEGQPPFNLLWSDVRPVSAQATWKLHTIRNTGGGKLYYPIDDMPKGYTLFVLGANMDMLGGSILTQEKDTVLTIIAIEGKIERKCAIMLPEGTEAVTVVEILKDGEKISEVTDTEIRGNVLLFDPDIDQGRYTWKIGKDTGEFILP